jgi:uncharacterized repeat protein (TIGR02543 family)
LTDATDDIRMKGATKTYVLPASALSMKQLDLTEGDVTTESHVPSDFTVSFTNSSFSQTNGTITATPPAGQHITEGYMTVTWKGAPLSFTTVPISRTYHVVWDDLASSYMISFNSQGGSALSPIVGAYGSPVTLPTPTRAGYTFGGWYTTAACTGTAYTATTMPATNPTLYAKWTPGATTQYTVRHYQQALAGTSYVLFATQNLTGATATSVTPAVNSYAGFTAPATQTVVIAGAGTTVVEYRYTRNSYQLTFTPGTPDADIVRTVAFGGQIAPPTVARAGYTFGGWYTDAACTTASTATTMPAANLHMYAKWTANANTAYSVKHYQENIAAGTYTLAATQTFSGTSGTSVTPAPSSYAGFTAPTTPQTVTIKGDGSTVVNYYYTRNSYQVTFHPNNGQSDTISTIKYGALMVLPTVTRAGHTFAGWYDNDAFTGTPYAATSTMPAASLGLYAKWTANTNTAYTVKHYQEPVTGTSWDLVDTETLTGTTGSQVTPAVKTYEGFMSPTLQTVTINADGSTIVEYRYYRVAYRAWFHQNNNYPSIPVWCRYGTQIEAPTVTWAGYTFVDWYLTSDCSGDPYVFGTMPASNLDLYAKWTANTNTPYTVRHYQQTVDRNTDVLVATQNLTGTTASQVTPAVNTYAGFTTPATQTVTISGDGSTIVEYYYYRNSYDVTFHPNNGGTDTTSTLTYGASIETPSVSKEGYTLAGWYDNAEFTGTAYTTTSTVPAHNLDLYAKWTSATVVLYQVNARSDLTQTDSIDWGQFGDPYGHNPMSYANPPAGVKTANGYDVVVTSERALRFSVNSQGWSWGGPYGAFAYRDALLQNEGGDSKPFTDDLASPVYDPLTLDFGTHPILAGGLQLEPLWHGTYTARIEAFDTTGSSLGSFTVAGDSLAAYVRHSNMEEYYTWGYGNSGSGSNTAAFVGVRSDVPIKKLVFTLLSCGPTTGGTRYQLGAFAVNRLSIESAPVPE